MRKSFLCVMGAVLALGSVGAARAQTMAPQTYSYSEDPAFSIIAPTLVTLRRDGPKEAVDQVIPPSPGRDKEFRSHILYDFAAHKIYTQVQSDEGMPCSVMDYTSPGAPPEFDVISGAADLMKEFTDDGKVTLTPVGAETLNGVPTKIVEAVSPQGKGRIWLSDQGNYPLKVVFIGPDGKEQTVIEVKALSFARPPASAFTPPANCQAIQGEATENSVHTGPPESAKPAFHITAVNLQPIAKYSGACPAHVKMTGTITADGPGTVWYRFGAGQLGPDQTLKFAAAGTQTVSHVFTFVIEPQFGNDMGGSAILQSVMEDMQGGHSEADGASSNADFAVHCVR
jgi:hypothetical protein